MTRRLRRRTIHWFPCLGWLSVAVLAVLLSASFLTAGASAAAGATSSPAPDAQPALERFGSLGHSGEPESYLAQGLLQARWNTGAVQAGWTHRPVWQSPVTGDGVRVAVIDTGVDASHPDLSGRVVAWRDFVAGRERPYDDTGHGTHVAGIIAAGGHPQLRPDQAYFMTGARGLAPDAQILAAKAMDETGRGDPHRIAEAILWALDQDAHVINLSLGISLPPAQDEDDVAPLPGRGGDLFSASSSMNRVEDAIKTATRAGAIVVVAAGNHDAGEPGDIMFPGTMSEVITVGAVDPRGRVAAFSNAGEPGSGKPDLVAPGVVVSTSPGASPDVARYRGLGGTSMAAPFVSGAIALILEANPGLMARSGPAEQSGNTDEVRAILTGTALGVAGARPQEQGAGLLRVDSALEAAGTGEAKIRPTAYAAPFVLAAGGYWVVRRRRNPRAALSERGAKGYSGPASPAGSVYRGPHGGPEPLPAPGAVQVGGLPEFHLHSSLGAPGSGRASGGPPTRLPPGVTPSRPVRASPIITAVAVPPRPGTGSATRSGQPRRSALPRRRQRSAQWVPHADERPAWQAPPWE